MKSSDSLNSYKSRMDNNRKKFKRESTKTINMGLELKNF